MIKEGTTPFCNLSRVIRQYLISPYSVTCEPDVKRNLYGDKLEDLLFQARD